VGRHEHLVDPKNFEGLAISPQCEDERESECIVGRGPISIKTKKKGGREGEEKKEESWDKRRGDSLRRLSHLWL